MVQSALLPPSSSRFDALLQAAMLGQSDALGQLFEGVRSYLHLLASKELGVDLQPKVGASDLVQKTFLDVRQSIEQFQGTTPGEFKAWVERILRNNLSDCAREFRATEKRCVNREVAIGDSAMPPELVADDTTPSQRAIAQEERTRLNEALTRLPEDYRRVILLRSQEKRPFEEIGRLMNRSTDAAKKLWGRAVLCLSRAMEVQ